MHEVLRHSTNVHVIVTDSSVIYLSVTIVMWIQLRHMLSTQCIDPLKGVNMKSYLVGTKQIVHGATPQ